MSLVLISQCPHTVRLCASCDSHRLDLVMEVRTEFSAYFPYFEKIKVGLCDLCAVCVSVYPSTAINF
jgi:hypothetical protein